MKCPICESTNARVVCDRHPGYVEGTSYRIFGCCECGTHFISNASASERTYDAIYAHKGIAGYDRYYRYVKGVKESETPLKFLSDNDISYSPVYEYLKGKKGLAVLDVGCGYGYLTYALNQSGHKAVGIDVSGKAIDFALKNFGPFFVRTDVDSFARKSRSKFDLIVAAELLEHLPQPDKFVKDCLKLLKRGGALIVTTPDKDFSPGNAIWQTELPPVHTTWLGRGSFKRLARRHRLKLRFFRGARCSDRNNILVEFLLTSLGRQPTPGLRRNGTPIKLKPIRNPLRKILVWLVNYGPARYASNCVAALLIGKSATLCVMLSRS